MLKIVHTRQDTGMTMVFLKVGQDVHSLVATFTEAINEGVAAGYVEGYLQIRCR